MFLDQIEALIPALRRYARALTGNADRADDLVQDSLERALRKRHLWRPQGSLRGWMFRILLNIYRNDLRRQSVAPHEPLDELPFEPAATSSQADRFALADIARALRQIPAEQKEALLLVALEGMSYAEAAKTLDIPIGTLMSRLSRARATLKILTDEDQKPRLRTVK